MPNNSTAVINGTLPRCGHIFYLTFSEMNFKPAILKKKKKMLNDNESSGNEFVLFQKTVIKYLTVCFGHAPSSV